MLIVMQHPYGRNRYECPECNQEIFMDYDDRTNAIPAQTGHEKHCKEFVESVRNRIHCARLNRRMKEHK